MNIRYELYKHIVCSKMDVNASNDAISDVSGHVAANKEITEVVIDINDDIPADDITAEVAEVVGVGAAEVAEDDASEDADADTDADEVIIEGQFHGKSITNNDISDFPKRKDFTCELYRGNDIAASVKRSVSRLRKNKTGKILFLPNDIRPMDRDFKYYIFMFGITMDGSKTLVILKNVPIYIDVRYPQKIIDNVDYNTAESQFFRHIKETYLKKDNGWKLYDKLETVEGFPLKGFHTKPVPYLRIHFKNIRDRGEVLGKLQPRNDSHANGCAHPFELASNDSNNDYMNKIARDFKYYPCGWNYFMNGVIIKPATYSNNCTYVFEVDINDFKAYELEPSPELTPRNGDSEIEIARRVARNVEIVAENTRRAGIVDDFGYIFEKDRTMVMTWDIETKSKDLLSAGFTSSDQFNIFMICATFHWHHDDTPLVSVCLVDKPTDRDSGWLTVICGNERGVVTSFINMMSAMAPDITMAFNGGGFDWNCLNIKLEHYSLMNVFKSRNSALALNEWEKKRFRTRRHMKIKISADQPTYEMDICDLPGMIDTDVMPVFKQLYTRDDIGRFQGLNFFAQKNKLGGKEDMPYKVMFAIYDGMRVDEYDRKRERVMSSHTATPEENSKDMREVARYCIKDALLCQQLYVIRSIVPDKRELSNMSRVTLFDSFYRAGGCKVLNTLGYYCNWYDEQEDIRFNIMFDNHHHAKKNISYPGGYVPKPEYGLEKVRPVTGLDFASLYPSLQMAYNFSPDKAVYTTEDADRLKAEGYTLHPVHVPVTRTTAGISGGSDIVKIEDVDGWMVRHCEDKLPSESLEGEQMGIIPYILRKLFANRNRVKQEKIVLSKIKETMEVAGDDESDEYNDVVFRWNMTDTKQKAMKVIMNTFYGKAGDSSSSIFELLVSGGITEMGQKNIKFVAKLSEDIGCFCKYGDTDSVYVTCPTDTYTELNEQYATAIAEMPDANSGNEAYRTLTATYHNEKVALTMLRIAKIRDSINASLIVDNGTKYLKIAYEEVLYPVVFAGKKKYFGVAHEGEPKFIEIKTINDIFVRGIDVIKQGQTMLAKRVGFEIMRDVLGMFNELSLMDLVRAKIDEIYTTEWDSNYFIQKLKYRPDKQNIRVLKFVERMKVEYARYPGDAVMRELYSIPEAGEPFECVVVKKSPIFTEEFKPIKLGVGDQMEYINVYTHSQTTQYPMQINLDYYIKGAIIGLFARFVSYFPDFQSETDAVMIKKATKYIGQICTDTCAVRFPTDGGVHEDVKKRQRRLFMNTKRKVTKTIQDKWCSGSNIIKYFDAMDEGISRSHVGPELFAQLTATAEQLANDGIPDTYGKAQIKTWLRQNADNTDMDIDINDMFDDNDSEMTPNEQAAYAVRVLKAEMGPISLIKLNKLYGENGLIYRTREKLLHARLNALASQLLPECGALYGISYNRKMSIIRLIDDCKITKEQEKVVVDAEDILNTTQLSDEHQQSLTNMSKINTQIISIKYLLRKDALLRDALSSKLRQVREHEFVSKVADIPADLTIMNFDAK